MLSPALACVEPIVRSYVPGGMKAAWERELADLDPRGLCDGGRDERALTAFIEQASEIARRWAPQEVREACESLTGDEAPVCVYLTNLPVGDVGEVPVNGQRPKGKSPVSEGVLLGLAGLVGHPFAYLQELGGNLPQQIAPAYGKERSQSSQGRDTLAPHSDFAALAPECRPEFLALLGLVNECSSETLVYPVDEVVERLPLWATRALSAPQFRVEIPETARQGTGPRASGPHPVLVEGQGGLTISLSSAGIEPLTDEGAAALDELRSALRTLRGYRFAIQPGEMLIFNNLRTLHARTQVTGRRWLQRTYFTRSADALRHRDPSGVFRFDARRLTL